MSPTGPLPPVRFNQNPSSSLAPRHSGLGSYPVSDSVPSVSLSSGYSTHLPASYSPAVSFGARDVNRPSSAQDYVRPSISQTKQTKHPIKPSRPEDVYPTPPPSPDLIDNETVSVLPESSDPVEPVIPGTPEQPYRPTVVSDQFHPVRQTTEYIPHLPAIPISLLLNTPHTLPHAAPFKLAQPTGILSVLGGNRVLQVEGASRIMDRMPYSAASTNGLLLTQDQGEEASVEAMLADDRPHSKTTPLSPDQTRVSSIFIHPPTPDREENGNTLEPLLTVDPGPSGSRSASPRTSPAGSPMGSPRVVSMRPSASAPPVPLHVLPEVRSPPRNTLEMANDSVRLAQQKRGRRPRLFGFTELPDSSGSSAASSRNPSPERSSSTSHEIPNSSSMGPASSAPGNFLPRRQQPVRAKSDTNLHAIRGTDTSSPLASSSLVSRAGPSSSLSPPERQSNGQVTMTSRRNTGLKLDFTGITPLNAPSIDTPSAVIPSPYSAKLIRKKSGEILKPALKYGGPLAANGTPLEAPPPPEAESQFSRARFESKSLPTTPSCPKYVHFDAQLERVKLFQKEQKPSVVSRNGSPTGDYTTSEGEEYPFPSTDEEGGDKRERKVLQINLPNFPTHQAPDADLFLESLFLDDDRKSLRGIIQVRNMAFQKWVAVRFTFDWWQTTSEVTATHKDSVKGGKYDRFSFVIKLHDLLNKIEEKTLFMAIRYNTDGKEIWDSNSGHNYQVLFEKTFASSSRLVPKRNQPTIQPGMGKAIGGRTSQWSVTSGRDDDRLADLRAKLDRLQADDCTSPPLLSPASSRHNSFSPQRKPMSLDPSTGSPRRSVSAYDARPNNKGDLPAAGPALAARYDFGAALKSARRNSNSPKGSNTDLPNVRTGLLQYGQNANLGQPSPDRGRPTMDFYSPRSEYAQLSPTDGFFSQAITGRPSRAANGSRDGKTSPPTPTAVTTSSQASSVSSSREASATPPNYIPVPEVQVSGPSPDPSPNQDEAPSQPTSAAVSPPQLESSNESVNDDDTPSESPKSPPESTMPRWSPTDVKGHNVPNGFDSYASFIEQFCWGGGSSNHTTAYLDRPALERRAHSTSSLDAYFSSHGSPPMSSSGHMTPKGNRPMSGGYFAAAAPPSQSTSASSNGYYSAFSTPTRTDERHTDSSTAPHGANSASASAMGLEFGGLDMNLNNRGHRSPPVLC